MWVDDKWEQISWNWKIIVYHKFSKIIMGNDIFWLIFTIYVLTWLMAIKEQQYIYPKTLT